jgi:hypothetical protein
MVAVVPRTVDEKLSRTRATICANGLINRVLLR